MDAPHRWNHSLKHAALVAVAATGFMIFAGAPAARADHEERYENCHQRIVRADHNLHEAIEHHGYRSGQANRARRNLANARQRCWNSYHRWWNEDDRTWHTDRDWRDEDHEHYRDRNNNGIPDREEHP